MNVKLHRANNMYIKNRVSLKKKRFHVIIEIELVIRVIFLIILQIIIKANKMYNLLNIKKIK